MIALWGATRSPRRGGRSCLSGALALIVMLVCPAPVFASADQEKRAGRSINDTRLEMPTWQEIGRVVRLSDANTRWVVGGVTMLGLAAGIVGTFLLLRKRALTADVLAHATFPGVTLAFMMTVAIGASGKSMLTLLIGATVFGVIGMLCILLIRNTTRLKDDAAMAIVLSVFFGLGAAMIGLIQNMPVGSAAGLQTFIFGKAATMLASDAMLMFWAVLGVAIMSILLFKELSLICFDAQYAAAQGWPIVRLDLALMGLVVAVTVLGLQSVGLLLVVALLIIPPAAARFWSDRLLTMTILSAITGLLSGYFGATISALVGRMPTGPIIVIVAAVVFVISMVMGTKRGVIAHAAHQARFRARTRRHHLLRDLFEWAEQHGDAATTEPDDHRPTPRVSLDHLLNLRSWSSGDLRRSVRHARRADLVTDHLDRTISLTDTGVMEAQRIVRNHRLWETYLITHADVAASQVDHEADRIEHVLGRELVMQLESIAAGRQPYRVPPSPHDLGQSSPAN